jgi:hypothetical protein
MLGSITDNFIGEPQAVHCGPWFCLSSMALLSVWRSKFADKPTGSFFGFHRIDKLDNALVNVVTSGTLERSNVKAGGARGNAGQHSSCLARWAKWPQDNHDASPWIWREHNHSQSPVYADKGR